MSEYLDSLDPGIPAFRNEIRRWMEAHVEPVLQGFTEYDLEVVMREKTDIAVCEAYERYNHASLAESLVCPQWPEAVGGRGLGPLHMAVLAEEASRVDMPRCTRGMGEMLVGPAVIAHGTTDQRNRILPRIIRGDDWYCQGFSEPDAGSDLAGVSCRGVVDGDELVITGQKVWTSHAHLANVAFVLVRTDPASQRHAGLSFVLVAMDAPGVEVRELRTMTGDTAFSELFLTDVRTPLDNVIGGLNHGWATAMTTLGNERGAQAATQHLVFERELEALTEHARNADMLDDPQFVQRLVWAYSKVQLMRFAGLRLLCDMAHGVDVEAQAPAGKLAWSEYHRALGELAITVGGLSGLVLEESGAPTRWQKVLFESRAETIYAGTSEIQRKIIAERVLGLPRSRVRP